MTTVVAAAALVPLEAPLPSPRSFDLLSTVTLRELEGDRWLGGAWTGGDVPGPAFTHDPCSTGTGRVKQPAGIIGTQKSGRFSVYVPGFCTAQSIGPDPDYWTARLEKMFQLYESAAVERVLATADGHMTFGPYLGDANLERLNGAVAIDPVNAYGLLEEAIAKHAGGVLHIGPRTFAAWNAANLVSEVGGIMLTELRTPVVVGYGYAGVTPDAGPPPVGLQEWAFASGPLEIIRDRTVTLTPTNYAEALDRSVNDVLFLAERPYLLNWFARTDPGDPDHTQAGVLIDLSASSGGSGASYTIETPSGPVDGMNDTFTLAETPDPPDALLVWKNGLLMTQNIDYTLTGSTIIFDPEQIPAIDSILTVGVPT